MGVKSDFDIKVGKKFAEKRDQETGKVPQAIQIPFQYIQGIRQKLSSKHFGDEVTIQELETLRSASSKLNK